MKKKVKRLIGVIETNLGKADIILIPASTAQKYYKCPLCECEIEVEEEHVCLVPQLAVDCRRHVHTQCLEAFKREGLKIKLDARKTGWRNDEYN